jgi:Domain of unknown function (DUF6089)
MKSLLRSGAIALLLMASTTGTLKAQYAWDFGVHVGGANYLGEMGGKEQTRRDFIWDLKMSQTRWCVGGFARRKLNRLVSVNAGLLYLRIQGADALSTNRERVGRNLNFRNDMFEAYLRGEFTIFADNDLGGRGRYKTDFRLFGYAGVAAFLHNPKGQINREGAFYNLADYNTELVDYSNIGVAIPVGIGFHFTKKRRHRFGWDFGWRTTFTDYLDDVSTTYKNYHDLPDGGQQLYDMSDYVTHGTQFDSDNNGVFDPSDNGVLNEDSDNPALPGQEQYGWEGDTEPSGPSKLTENKRGDPTHNDSYMTMTFTYSYVLRGQSNFYRQRYNWMRGKKRIGRKSRAKF